MKLTIKGGRAHWNVIRGVIHIGALVLGIAIIMLGYYLLDVPADLHWARMAAGTVSIFWGFALLRTINALPRTSWEYLTTHQVIKVRKP